MAEQYLTISHVSTKDLERFFSKIQVSTEHFYHGTPCWDWRAALMEGYGCFGWRGKNLSAHRFIYAWLVEALPCGRGKHIPHLDHLCRRPRCCNPLHLELVSMKVNILRGMSPFALNAAKTHCKRGHPLSGDNVHIMPNGYRECRKCRHWKCAPDPVHAREMDRIRRKRYYDRHAEDIKARRRAYTVRLKNGNINGAGDDKS